MGRCVNLEQCKQVKVRKHLRSWTRWQKSVSVVALSMIVVACLLGGAINRWWDQYWAANAVLKRGGRIEISGVWEDAPSIVRPLSLCFGRITGVFAKFSNDDTLQQIAGLRDIKQLDLAFGNYTADGLSRLSTFPELIDLDLTSSNLTDGDLEAIADLRRLEWLSINCTSVTDAGIVCLQRSSRLRLVGAFGTHITEKGARDLEKALPGCKVLNECSNCPVNPSSASGCTAGARTSED